MSATKLIPRPEHPKPQFFRENWRNLNGEWEFEFDFGDSGEERGMAAPDAPFTREIIVPFCPQSELSGIGYLDFFPASWYRKTISLSKEEASGRVLLHFGAVDYQATVFVNGQKWGTHRGGYVSFTCDITAFVREGENTVTLLAQDDNRSGLQPHGKQSHAYYSQGCDYTRTNGIWQTVWLEFVPKVYLDHVKLVPDCDNSKVDIEAFFGGVKTSAGTEGLILTAEASFGGKAVGSRTVQINGQTVRLELPLDELHLWEIGSPALYDITYTLRQNGSETDSVKSYFGMRSIEIRDHKLMLNHRPVFQRLILDQGFYPDGIYTAPNDEALKRDIELSMELGFNGARFHQKVFEERSLYWADRLGYLVWGEHASWGLNIRTADAIPAFLPEWLEIMERDYNHPSIIGWCPFNETEFQRGTIQNDEILRVTYLATKALDPTRPVIDTSGYFHVMTDIFDIHDYEQDVEVWKERYSAWGERDVVPFVPVARDPHNEAPYFISEYGGARWAGAEAARSNAWGYGDAPKTEEEFLERYAGLTDVLLDNPNIGAFCYTQLTDVEQECNGMYTYARKRKFSDRIYEGIRAVNIRKAAMEEE